MLPIKFGVGQSGDIEVNTNLTVHENLSVAGTCVASNLVIGPSTLSSVIHTATQFKSPVSISAAFSVYGTTQLGANGLTVGTTGLVGIGTNAPGENLDVNGNIRASGSVTAANFIGSGAGLTGFAPSARIDTTCATNVSSGTLACERLPKTMNSTTFIGGVNIGLNPGPPSAAAALNITGDQVIRPAKLPLEPLVSSGGSYTMSTAIDGLTYSIAASYDEVGARAWHAFQDPGAPALPPWLSRDEYCPGYINRYTGPIQTIDSATGAAYNGHWVQILLPRAVYLYGYHLRLAYGVPKEHTPANWALFGSLNNSDWTLLDHREDSPITSTSRFVLPEVPARAYNYYRVVITALQANNMRGFYAAALTSFALLVTPNAPYRGLDLRGPLSVCPGAAAALTITREGLIGIGTNGPTAALDIAEGIRIRGLGAGPVYADSIGRLSAYTPDSNILTMTGESFDYGLDSTMALRPTVFKWGEPDAARARDIGLISQEVRDVIPEAVSETLALDYTRVIPVLVKAIQELNAKVQSTSADAILAYNSNLEVRIAKIEKAIKNINLDLDQLFAYNCRQSNNHLSSI